MIMLGHQDAIRQQAGIDRSTVYFFFLICVSYISWAQPLECDEDWAYPRGWKYTQNQKVWTVQQSKAGTIISFFFTPGSVITFL